MVIPTDGGAYDTCSDRLPGACGRANTDAAVVETGGNKGHADPVTRGHRSVGEGVDSLENRSPQAHRKRCDARIEPQI